MFRSYFLNALILFFVVLQIINIQDIICADSVQEMRDV